MDNCSSTYGHAKKVELKLPAIIANALVLGGSNANDWVKVTTKLEWILMTYDRIERSFLVLEVVIL
jgi:hypothetical protein